MRGIACATAVALFLIAPCLSSAKVSDQKAAELREDAFGAAQGVIVSAAADALSNVALNIAQGPGELAEQVRRRLDLINQVDALQRQFDRTYDDKGADAEANRTRIREQKTAFSALLDDVDKQIARKYPRYSELTRPRPLTSATVQAILNENEALLVIVPTPDATYVFAVTREHFDWARSTLTASDVTTAVTTLRQGLDDHAPLARGNGDSPGRADGRTGLEFNRQVAYQLYSELVKPLEPLFAGKKVLLTATAGALQSLPLSVLVTDPPQGSNTSLKDISDTHWLIDRYALATLPAISSLLTLRCYSATDEGHVHDGCPAVQGPLTAPPRTTLDFAGVGDPVLEGRAEGLEDRGSEADYRSVARGERADTEAIRRLPRLPWTADELKAIADYFPKRASLLLLDAQATESAVRNDARLSQARILDFATHTFVSGDRQFGEPGLVMTPPKTPTDEDDGFLSASEAAQLHISAEFVILSACNTARTDGTLGADGLAGLSRAFFYAGARAMLVSHWAVNDKATSKLMQAIFDAMRNTPDAGRAMALQSAIRQLKSLQLKDEPPSFVEPRYWAPFVLVGEVGRSG